ncbi:hypothetical protein PISL3812_07837 [Talaromyces islandicus]|uniref:Myb-like domain-containing protein n=1 Tax=Talaromyces islandicus TaxID=28573 RepID=A0A0U1M607_TALIS|nr:hypothetical protein PISL3812_07837 [Talaromyces islandicus]
MSSRTRRQRAKKDTTAQSVDFINNLNWNSGGESDDESTTPRKDGERQRVDSTSRNSPRLHSSYEVPKSPGPETRRSSRRNLHSLSNQLQATMKESIKDGSPPVEAEGSEEEEEEEEEGNNDHVSVKEEPGNENEDEGGDDDGDTESESDHGSSASDSDSAISESAKQLADGYDHDRNITVEVAMPPLGLFGDNLSKKLSEGNDRSQGTGDSGETNSSKSDDSENSGEESQNSEEIEPQSWSEYNDSENEQQSEGEQETFETPPQQLGNNRSGSVNQTDGFTLGGTSQIITVSQRPQARSSSHRSTINRKRKGQPSLTELVSKSPRADRQTSHSVSADPSHPPRHGYVEWEYDMEAENHAQRNTTADADDLLFEEAAQVMGLQRSWKRLMSGCHELRTREAYIRPVFNGIESFRDHIFNMQKLYKQMQEDRRTGSTTVDLKDDLQTHGELVREKATTILMKLVNRADTANATDNWDMKGEASTLAEIIMLDVVTELGDLAKECLKAYYSESSLAEGGFVAVLEILETMQLLDGKIFSLRSCYRINVLDYGRDIRSALSNLWKRMDQGEFYERQRKHRRPAPKPRPWTEDEEVAVIERLHQYENEEQRYQYVAEDYPHEVGGRTANEIRKKARELYDDYLQAKDISLTWLL